MKKKSVFTLFLLTLFMPATFSQVTDLGKFLSGSVDDAQVLLTDYMAPYFNGFGASLTGGWYNTAKVHKLGGFDLTATLNSAIVPTAESHFDIPELSSMQVSGNDVSTPTISGPKEQGPMIQYNPDIEGVDPIDAYRMPKGINNRYVPSPMLQLGVGLFKGTEIQGRYMPTFTYGESKIGMWGIGLKHDLKQWIPVIEKVPVLHVAIQGGMTKLNSEIGIEVEPEDINASGMPGADLSNWDNQKMVFEATSITVNLIGSVNLPVISFYGGLGIANTKSNLKMEGDYPTVVFNTQNPTGQVVAITDPLNIEVKNSDGSTTKPRLNVGMRLKLGVITLHGDYTYAYYSVVSAGLGVTFR